MSQIIQKQFSPIIIQPNNSYEACTEKLQGMCRGN